MAQYSTTLALPCAIGDSQITVADPMGITWPGVNGTTPCWICIDSEKMQVDVSYSVPDPTTLIPVVRGFNGTIAQSHAVGAAVTINAFDVNEEPFGSE